MKNDVVVLSLGHNSSAVLVRGGEVLAGYEEERLSMVKSDSRFPLMALGKLNENYDLHGSDLIASHWYPDGFLPASGKHWKPEKCKGFNVMGLDFLCMKYSHHDAHRDSALVFAGDDFPKKCHIIVMDGFGTLAEHTSVYERDEVGDLHLLNRYYGYKYSAGLFYQYATKFCGMTMHVHEYKMLAFETRILSVLHDEEVLGKINDYIDEFSGRTFHYMINDGSEAETTLKSLPRAEEFVYKTLTQFIKKFYGYAGNSDMYVTKVLTSYFAQRHLENIVKGIRNLHQVRNLIVAGGVFYNVKINHLLCDSIPGKFCAMPLAGDQGAGLGLYQTLYGDLKWPDHLFWGHRSFNRRKLIKTKNIKVVEKIRLTQLLTDELRENERVNLLRGSMEFGPRALCNTSTLALPTMANTIMINTMNGRTTEMPFGLVMSENQVKGMLENTDKVHKSLDYMIMARRVKHQYNEELRCGAHYYPIQGEYTCRPQITRDPVMLELVDRFGPLINTSWNFHGLPIVYSTESAIVTHLGEQDHSPKPINTVVEGE